MFWRWFRQLAQNIRVNQILHSVSVDSESIGGEKPLVGAGEQPVNGALVWWSRAPSEAIFSSIKTLHLELLARLNTVQLPELRRQDDLALGRDSGFHNM